jgi:hypothetical protein
LKHHADDFSNVLTVAAQVKPVNTNFTAAEVQEGT